MEKPINAVRSKDMGFNKGAKTLHIPKTALFRLHGKNDESLEAVKTNE
jgi:hypothetical protein